jgi:chemosensory pili system protein ChpA (sensor histidine kinase/response regulator)
MNEAIDLSALNWVQQELGETLRQGRLFLEEYAEGDRDAGSLNKCMTCLHEARGPLRIVELNGADLLATEMEEVLNDLLHERLDNDDTAMQALMQAFIQLPDYLVGLRSSRHESTAVLLPVINELRAVRGVAAMPEDEVFSPGLYVDLPAAAFDPQLAGTLPEASRLARSLRQCFQAGLLEWYRSADNSTGLQSIFEVTDSLRAASRQQAAARLWWLAGGLTEVLLADPQTATIELKQLMGQVDRQIKHLIDVGDAGFAAQIPEALLESLLKHITASEVETGQAGEIRRTLAPAGQPAAVELGGRNIEVLNTVMTEVLQDLEKIKEPLDRFIDNEGSADDLKPVIDDLQAMANTLGISGIDDACGTIEDVIKQCREITSGSAADTDAVLEGIAGSLVAVETSIRDMCARELTQESGSSTANLAWNEGLAAVVNAVVADMAAAKEHIDSYLQAPESSSRLEKVPGLLQQIRGGLQLAGQDRAATLVERVAGYFDTALLHSEQLPDSTQLDMLADAICSIEYFVEELGEHRDHGGMVLDIAEQSLQKLGAGTEVAGAMVAGSFEDQGAAAEPASEAVGCEVTDEQSATVIQPVDTPVISELQVLPDESDAEILEIFIEEVEGELAQLSRLIPGWVADTENREMIETICRSFHTLKGGGRMVGALALAEFSWAFEHLLNQVVEGKLNAGAKFFELVLEASESLGQLLEQVKNGTAPEADVDALVARATAMLNPAAGSDEQPPAVIAPLDNALDGVDAVTAEDAGEPDAGVPEPDAPVTADEAAHPADALPVLVADADPEIVEIFMEEAAEVLEEITAQLPAWVENQDNIEALATVRRCLHTFKGSGRMAGAMLVGEFSWAIESLFNRVIEGAIPADAAVVAVANRLLVPLTELVAQVNGGPQPESDYRGLMLAAEQLVRGEQPDMSALTEQEPPAGDDAVITAAEDDGETEVIDGEIVPEEPEANDDEPDIIDIFRSESVDHLAAIHGFINECRASATEYTVSEPLYRALHTLSGITESAELPVMHSLTQALYGYFGELDEQQLPVSTAALDVLDNCRAALAGLVERLPLQDCDTDWLNALLTDIASLPVEAPAGESDVQEAPTAEVVTDEVEAAPDIDDSETAPAEDTEAVPVEAAAVVDTSAVHEPPAEEPPSQAGDFAGMDPELLEIFIEEATDIIDGSETTLRAWKDDHNNCELIDEFQRQLHTLKGGARMLELGAIGDLSHGVETLLTRVVDGQVTVSGSIFDCLHKAHDTLAVMLDKVKTNEMPASAPELEQLLDQLSREPEAAAADVAATGEPVMEADPSGQVTEAVSGPEPGPELEPDAAMVAESAAVVADDLTEMEEPAVGDVTETAQDERDEEQPAAVMCPAAGASEIKSTPRQVERRKHTRVRTEQVRIQADLLDNLVNYVGEINIYRSRLEQQFGLYRFNIEELQHTVSRLRDQMRQLEIETETQILFRYEQEAGDTHAGFDPLELDRYSNLQQQSRSLMESIGDLESIHDLMGDTTRESETLLLQQSRVTADLQEGLLRTRMVPFASLAPRLRRIVRQAASELGKRVELHLEGAEGEMDRTVVEHIIAPLEHMLRNAVDHGIEKPADRKQAGKPQSGSIQIGFHREGPEIVLRIADDGHGIDLQALRAKAIERELMTEDALLSDDEVMQFILQSGLSTATEVTQISGRGVGMDVVNSEVRKLGGSLHIDSEAGKGSLFTVRLPYTLAINQVLLVSAGEENFCIPLGSIEGVVRVSPDQLSECYAEPDPVYDYAGNRYQLRHLGSLLGTGGMVTDNASAQLPVLLIRIGEKRIALQVEALHGNREIVVKPLGVQLSHVNGISGATILGDGRVVLILDMASVVRMEVRQPVSGDAATPRRNDRITVMVVDDSITVRKVTTRLLQQHGFEVVTAKDGVDALGQLEEYVPDMMLLDIEMPRMDGFELATHMRNDERFRHIPITMITSRTGDKHRERAREIGVDHYLGKPYQENELLDTIYQLLGISSDEPDSYQEQADG